MSRDSKKPFMIHPQLLVYEADGSLARLLRPLAEKRKWSLREPRRPESCRSLLQRGHASVLVMKLGRDVIHELELLEEVHRLHPTVAAILVSDTNDPTLAGLGWDLGASYVLAPPQPRDRLTDIVTGLMASAIASALPASGPRPESPRPAPGELPAGS